MRKVLYILGELEDSDLQWMVDAGTLRQVAAGIAIIEEDVQLASTFIVVAGELAVSRGGTEIARLGSGEIVGDMSLLDSRPPVATVTAVEEATVFAIPQQTLRSKLASDTGFASRFYRALCIFLANRVSRMNLMVNAIAAPQSESDQLDEISPDTLENVALAGARFDWFLKRIRSK
jgi:CRP-like cAMP-binding protein